MQEHPALKVAHRTSPTNMGLSLLANLSAHDFGYLSTGQLVVRTTNALRTMESLERYRGHFYNWYDTQTRLPLAPLYVSTVDSGNLAGHLLTLRPGLTALIDAPILNSRWLEGISDTFWILADTVGDDSPAALGQFEQTLDLAAVAKPATLAEAMCPSRATGRVRCRRAAEATARFPEDGDSAAGFWAAALATAMHRIAR